MNAKPILIFSAIAAASMGAMATAYVVEQRNSTARVAELAAPLKEAPIALAPKVEEKLAVVETPKPVEAPKNVEVPKLTETPAVTELPKVADAPKVIEVPKVADAPKVIGVPKVAEELKTVEETKVAVLLPEVKPPTPVVPRVVVEPKIVVVPEKPVEPVVALTTEPPPTPRSIVADPPAVASVVENALPAFDTVRVEATGDAVIAGRADPGSDVTIKWNGKFVGKTIANSDGSFVLVPEKPMKIGIGALTIEMSKNGQVVQSEGSVIVAVKANAPALVAKIDPIAPTAVIQAPATTDALASGEVQLNAVDYDSAGNIVFSGRAEPGSIVRFYVDNALTGEVATTGNGQWTFRGDERVSPGQHVLRADAVDAKGKVKSRIELPFLRETAEVVAAAKIVIPETIIKKTPAVPVPEETAVATLEKKRSITIEKSVVGEAQVAAPEEPAKLQTPVVEQKVAATPEAPAVADTPSTPEAVEPVTLGPQKLVIQPGNNLWKLSREIYGKGRMFTVIYEANRDQVRNPNRIYPGQILTAPTMPN